jgi:predicted deacylase
MACASGTIELRSSNDVSEKAAHRDARALERYLMRVGAIRKASAAGAAATKRRSRSPGAATQSSPQASD